MSISPFNRARPMTSLQEPSRIESSAGNSDGGPSVGELLEAGLADISVKSMGDVAAGVRATGGGKKSKGVGGKMVGAPASAMQAPMQTQPGLQTQGNQNDSIAEKIRQAVERSTSTTGAAPVGATDAFDTASSSSHRELSSFSDDASSTPATQSNPDASVKAFALAPVRLRG